MGILNTRGEQQLSHCCESGLVKDMSCIWFHNVLMMHPH